MAGVSDIDHRKRKGFFHVWVGKTLWTLDDPLGSLLVLTGTVEGHVQQGEPEKCITANEYTFLLGTGLGSRPGKPLRPVEVTERTAEFDMGCG